MESNTIKILLRKALESDMLKVFELANDPIVRSNSFNKSKIELEDHKKWFSKKLSDPNCFFFICEDHQSKQFIGYVRAEHKDNEWELSIALSKIYRGKGYGTQMINDACEQIKNTNPNSKIIAWVQEKNIGSIKSFNKAGFVQISEKLYDNQKYLKLSKS